MDAISDPSSAGRGDRRRAIRAVDHAFAQGHITAPDRESRVAQVKAARTRGDVAMVTRDLPVGRGDAPGASTTRPQGAGGAQQLGTQAPQGSRVARVVLTGVVVLVLVAVGLIGFVFSLLSSVESDPTERVAPTATSGAISDPMTDEGWSEYLDELREQAGTTQATTVSILQTRVRADTVDDDRVTPLTYRDRSWEASPSTPRYDWQEPFDLADLDPAAYFRRALDHGDLSESDVSSRSIYVGAQEGDVRVIIDVRSNAGETVSLELDGSGAARQE